MTDMDEQVHWGWAENPSRYITNLWSRYKLTLEGFNKLWNEQGGKCVGCEKDLAHPTWRDATRKGLKPEVDHDHRTEINSSQITKVRGLLCKRCNGFMGKLGDNKDIFKRLAAYLEKHDEI